MYDHDAHSIELVTLYGMDWPILCIGTIACEHIIRGEITSAMKNIKFIEDQMEKLDEFASSTKPMMKGILSSFYLLLQDFQNAASMAGGIAQTQYPYFYKISGILQEGLAS